MSQTATRHPPHNARCGDVYHIDNREASPISRRELAGDIGISVKRANRRVCAKDPTHQTEISEGTYLATCRQHLPGRDD